MDWDRAYTPSPALTDPAAPTPLEVYWRIRTPSNKVVTCAIVRDAAPGLEVRAGFSDDDILRSQRMADLGDARALAAEWKRMALAKGFVEIADEGKGAM
jgi:hypothetical protein